MCNNKDNSPDITLVVGFKHHTGEFKSSEYSIRPFQDGDEVLFNLMSVWGTYTSIAYESITGLVYCRNIQGNIVRLIFVKQQPTGKSLEQVWYHAINFLKEHYSNKFFNEIDIMKDYAEAQ